MAPHFLFPTKAEKAVNIFLIMGCYCDTLTQNLPRCEVRSHIYQQVRDTQMDIPTIRGRGVCVAAILRYKNKFEPPTDTKQHFPRVILLPSMGLVLERKGNR